MGIRFDDQAKFNRHGRNILPSEVSKKEPLPMTYRPTQMLPAPLTSSTLEASSSDMMVPRTRDSRYADLAEFGFNDMRPPSKDFGPTAFPSRPDQIVGRVRRETQTPRNPRIELPFRHADRGHALFSQDSQLLAMRQFVADSQ